MARDHAIVLGGSISGLLAAAGLSTEFERVTIVDRDELLVDGPDAQKARRGVPQGEQVHHLLALGAKRMEQLLPGLDADLLAAGCEHHNDPAEFAAWNGGAWRARVEGDLNLVCFTRTLFEWVVRRRVLGLPNVTALKSVSSGLIASPDRTSVIGAKVKSAPGGELLGDLVVDATGRGTKSPNWIEDLGYDRPLVSQLRVYMGYTCYRVVIPEGVLPEGVTSLACGAKSPTENSLVIWPCGNGQHIVVGFGALRNYPPADVEGNIAVAERLGTPLLAKALRAATVVSEPKSYQMAGDQRLRWEDLDRRPDGFVVVGDAVASYNPAYGQGMTMAAVGAYQLRSSLRDAGVEIAGVADTFQKALAPHVDIAWDNALMTDSYFVGAEYENQDPPQQAPAEVAAAMMALAAEDPEVVLAMRRAMHWMDPSHLKTEAIQAKVAAWIAQGRSVSPESTDPLVVSRLKSVPAASLAG